MFYELGNVAGLSVDEAMILAKNKEQFAKDKRKQMYTNIAVAGGLAALVYILFIRK